MAGSTPPDGHAVAASQRLSPKKINAGSVATNESRIRQRTSTAKNIIPLNPAAAANKSIG